MSAILLARLATVLFVGSAGALIGYAARDSEEDQKPQTTGVSFEDAIKLRTIALGNRLLSERDESPPEDMEGLRAYLKQTYRGLYCISRAGGRLDTGVAESYALQLAQQHLILRPQHDKPISAWYQDFGNSSTRTLADMLWKCTEVKQLGIDPRYIARLFDEVHEGLTFDGLSEEAMARFAA